MATDDEFDQLADNIDFSAIGDDEWNAFQTQTQIQRQEQGDSAGTILPPAFPSL
jgi:hypothetical protein